MQDRIQPDRSVVAAVVRPRKPEKTPSVNKPQGPDLSAVGFAGKADAQMAANARMSGQTRDVLLLMSGFSAQAAIDDSFNTIEQSFKQGLMKEGEALKQQQRLHALRKEANYKAAQLDASITMLERSNDPTKQAYGMDIRRGIDEMQLSLQQEYAVQLTERIVKDPANRSTLENELKNVNANIRDISKRMNDRQEKRDKIVGKDKKPVENEFQKSLSQIAESIAQGEETQLARENPMFFMRKKLGAIMTNTQDVRAFCKTLADKGLLTQEDASKFQKEADLNSVDNLDRAGKVGGGIFGIMALFMYLAMQKEKAGAGGGMMGGH